MGSHSRPRPLRWASLLLMASVSSAQTLSLSSFQIITSAGTPLACILTYNSIIPNCRTEDFSGGRACSLSCVNGVRTVQRAVQQACDQVSASDGSILGQALAGTLLNVLCPGGGTTTSTSSKRTSSASTATTSSTISTTLSQITLTPVVSTTVVPSTTEILATDIPTLSPPSNPPLPPPPAPTQSRVSEQTVAPAEPTTDTPQGGGGGGGSPFDAVTVGGSSRPTINLLATLLVGVAVGLMLGR